MSGQDKHRSRLAWISFAAGLALTFVVFFSSARLTSPRRPTRVPAPPVGVEALAASEPSRPAAPGSVATRAARSANDVDAHPIAEPLARLEQALRAELDADPRHMEYQHCVAQSGEGSRGCRDMLSDALYSAISRVTLVWDEAGQLVATFGKDSERLSGALRAAIAGTRDPVRSLLALTLLEQTCPERGFPLPREAYDGLDQRTDPEAQKILDNHLVALLPDDSVREEVARLALDAAVDPRVRLSATRALGHDVDVLYIERVVASLLGGDPAGKPLEIEALPRALGGCGVACASVIEQLAVSPSIEMRRVAYRTVAVTGPSAADLLRKSFARISPDASNPERLEAELKAAETPFGRPSYPQAI